MTRFVLWLGALMFVPFGLWVLYDPTALSAISERPMPTPTAMTDSRAVDGGLVLGLGLLFVACAVDPTKARTGLLTMFLTFGGAFLGRCVGVMLDGGTVATYQVAAFELAGAALAAAALMRHSNALGGRPQ